MTLPRYNEVTSVDYVIHGNDFDIVGDDGLERLTPGSVHAIVDELRQTLSEVFPRADIAIRMSHAAGEHVLVYVEGLDCDLALWPSRQYAAAITDAREQAYFLASELGWLTYEAIAPHSGRR